MIRKQEVTMEWLCLTLLAKKDTKMLFNWIHLITKESFKVSLEKKRLDWKTKGHNKKGQKGQQNVPPRSKGNLYSCPTSFHNVTCSIIDVFPFFQGLRLKCQRLTKQPWCYFQASSTASVAKGSSDARMDFA